MFVFAPAGGTRLSALPWLNPAWSLSASHPSATASPRRSSSTRRSPANHCPSSSCPLISWLLPSSSLLCMSCGTAGIVDYPCKQELNRECSWRIALIRSRTRRRRAHGLARPDGCASVAPHHPACQRASSCRPRGRQVDLSPISLTAGTWGATPRFGHEFRTSPPPRREGRQRRLPPRPSPGRRSSSCRRTASTSRHYRRR